jgi:hypothetical protein
MPKGRAPLGKKIAAVRADSGVSAASSRETSKVRDRRRQGGGEAAIGHSKAVEEIATEKSPDGPPYEQDQESWLVVMRRPREQDLFEEQSPFRYHAIASNRADEDAATTMEWYSKRGDHSENRIKDLKIGFGMDYMPCGDSTPTRCSFHRRADHNLYSLRSAALGADGSVASADRVLAYVSDGGQDRSPWRRCI